MSGWSFPTWRGSRVGEWMWPLTQSSPHQKTNTSMARSGCVCLCRLSWRGLLDDAVPSRSLHQTRRQASPSASHDAPKLAASFKRTCLKQQVRGPHTHKKRHHTIANGPDPPEQVAALHCNVASDKFMIHKLTRSLPDTDRKTVRWTEEG